MLSKDRPYFLVIIVSISAYSLSVMMPWWSIPLARLTGKDAMLHSLSAQVSYYSDLIQNHPGWLYCGVFADEALTGTKENRTEFQRLLAECRAGSIDLMMASMPMPER